MTYSKSNLVKDVASENNLPATQVKEIIDSVLRNIKEQTKKGERVMLVGFGSFKQYETKPRIGRNPKTKEECPIPSLKKIKFKESKVKQ